MPYVSGLKFPSVNPIRERVYNHLRKAILSGQIPVGERLVESRLASQIGTSRTPIREALHKLELENLVSSIPRVGYFVRGLSEEDIGDICEIRSAIEGLATRRAISQITGRNLERLRKNIEQSRKVIDQGTTERMVHLDAEFHDILCQSSGSKRIHELSQTFGDYMLKFRIECLRVHEIAVKAVMGHEKIYRGICDRDLPMVQKYVDDHMKNVMEDVINYYRARDKSPMCFGYERVGSGRNKHG
jgi:DNA-binding GntR family transcriptional regulator